MSATLTSIPTISVGIDKEQDGTYTTQLWVTGLRSFAEAQAAADHLQRLFCGEEIDPADALPNTEAKRAAAGGPTGAQS